MRGLVAGFSLLIGLTAPLMAANPGSKPRIDSLTAERVDGRIAVSFHVANGLASDRLERIHAGLPVNQRHRVEVLARRSVPLWPSKVHARMNIDTSAVFDSLTQRYALTRTIRLGTKKKKKQALVAREQHSTDSIDEVRAWMGEFHALPQIELPRTDPDVRLRVRVESTLGRRFVMYMFPARQIVSAERKLDP